MPCVYLRQFSHNVFSGEIFLRRSAGAALGLIGVLSVLWGTPVLAQDEEEAPSAQQSSQVVLEPMVVTASSVERTQRDAPASISVITREDIEKFPVMELSELLGTVEGITLSRQGNQVAGVQIRGMDMAYTLILIDGKRVNSTNVVFRGNDYDTGWVPVSEIERIEVVRGPMSSLYGSDAIGGVVNIITRGAGSTWRGSLKADAIFQEDSAAGDSQSLSLSASGPLVKDVLSLRLGVGYDRREEDKDVNQPATEGGTAQPGFGTIENRHLNGMLFYTPHSDHELRLGVDTSRRDHTGFVLKREAISLDHRGHYDFGTSNVTVNLDETRNLDGVVTGQKNPNKANTNSVDGRVTMPLDSLNQILTVGAETRHEKLKDPTNLAGWPGTPNYGSDSSTSITQHALFLETEIALLDDLKLTLGNRFDDHENFGSNNSPRAYVVYHPTAELTVKGGWAKAFRAPTLLQGSENWGSVSCGSPTVGCYIVGSPELDPETSTSLELGVHLDKGAFGGSITLFRSELKNMISINNRTADPALAPDYPNFVGFLPDGRPIFSYENIASVESEGVEVGLRAQLSRAWHLRANYTYTDVRDTSGSSSQPVAYRPEHAANLMVDWKPGARWVFSGNVRYVGEQVLVVWNDTRKSAYTVADISAGWRFDDRITLRGGILNITDEGDNREISSDFNEEGRRLFVSVSANF
ncbi:TonB-dependent receptor [Desulfurispirillum indicum]|uniref:TonB-dependent receptor domain-containing protein n=1 Tax=Desulfurispirillum indicum TaxID=936456 RepID=UPI001CFC39EA|nr:TonB-dependent receptor [Desulfurispirillum indicum]UCZ57325.1 TonB-dependent receptor [Desulfurispirillum indicum]